MCRLIGIAANEATEFKIVLREAPRSLAALSREHRDGWGIAVFDAQSGKWSVEKGIACAGEDERFHRLAIGTRGDLLVSHVRQKTIGDTSLANTHPFERGGWVFAHNGTIRDVAWLRAQVSAERAAEIEGETDSELLFAWVLTRLDEAGVGPGPVPATNRRDPRAARRARRSRAGRVRRARSTSCCRTGARRTRTGSVDRCTCSSAARATPWSRGARVRTARWSRRPGRRAGRRSSSPRSASPTSPGSRSRTAPFSRSSASRRLTFASSPRDAGAHRGAHAGARAGERRRRARARPGRTLHDRRPARARAVAIEQPGRGRRAGYTAHMPAWSSAVSSIEPGW